MCNDLNVCVVDDDDQVRKLICLQLQMAGFTTIEVGRSTEALEVLRTSNAALVIVDLFMPDKDGLTLIPEIRLAYPAAKILAMSGSGESYLKQAKRAGADATLAKPFRRDDLVWSAKRLIAA
jgi:CheY-like chemotaxis protein